MKNPFDRSEFYNNNNNNLFEREKLGSLSKKDENRTCFDRAPVRKPFPTPRLLWSSARSLKGTRGWATSLHNYARNSLRGPRRNSREVGNWTSCNDRAQLFHSNDRAMNIPWESRERIVIIVDPLPPPVISRWARLFVLQCRLWNWNWKSEYRITRYVRTKSDDSQRESGFDEEKEKRKLCGKKKRIEISTSDSHTRVVRRPIYKNNPCNENGI